jgi:hypothetical protein
MAIESINYWCKKLKAPSGHYTVELNEHPKMYGPICVNISRRIREDIYEHLSNAIWVSSNNVKVTLTHKFKHYIYKNTRTNA